MGELDRPLPIPPEGTLSWRQDIEKYLAPLDRDRALSLLAHDGTFHEEPLSANGRNVTLPLKTVLNPYYDCMQISGGVYMPIETAGNDNPYFIRITHLKPGQGIQPPDFSRYYTHTYTTVSGNEFVTNSDRSPMGAYAQRVAERKIKFTSRASYIDETILTPLVLGLYSYTEHDDGEGGNPTAIILATLFGGTRADETFVKPFINEALANPDKLEAVLERHLDDQCYTLESMGYAASKIHSAGLIHNQLTFGNVQQIRVKDPTKRFLYVADWETTEDAQTDGIDPQKAHDIFLAFKSFQNTIGFIMDRAGGNDPARYLELSREGLRAVMSGYAGLERSELTISGELDDLIIRGPSNPNDYMPLVRTLIDLTT